VEVMKTGKNHRVGQRMFDSVM